MHDGAGVCTVISDRPVPASAIVSNARSADLGSSVTIIRPTVLLTDRAWPDDLEEREIVESAGFAFVSGPPEPAAAGVIEELVRQHQPAAILTCWAPVSAIAIGASPDLRVVARMGVGLDNIDVAAATEHGVL